MTKHRSTFAAIILVQVVLIGCSAQVQNTPRWIPGQRMAQVTDTLLSQAVAPEYSEYGYLDGVCLLAAVVAEGNAVEFTQPFDSGTEYIFLGVGDESVRNIDLLVIGRFRQQLAANREVDPRPVLRYTPTRTGLHTVRLQLTETTAGQSSLCGLLILQQRVADVPGIDIAETNIRSRFASAGLDELTDDVRFHEYESEWCLYGMVMICNQQMEMSGINVEPGRYLFTAIGDSRVSYLDLALRSSSSGSMLARSDMLDNSVPRIDFRAPSEPTSVDLTIRNSSSDGPSMIITVILEH